ncbi:Ribosomal protein L11 methyltransferase [Candidatus Anstonella stagnisolia]|nr:Ribosomal protein L11 methyltransferase [Candidatus Anstonella stagnisolia]
MEIRMSLLGKNNSRRLLSKADIKLLFGRITQNTLSLLPRLALNPKAAILYARVAAAFAKKDYSAVYSLKHAMFCSLFGIEYDRFEIVAGIGEGESTMVFGFDDLQVCNVIIDNQYDISEWNMKGKTVLDAGANTGVFSIFAAKLGAKKVYAFEPILENIECIRKNALANGVAECIVPVPMAIGDKKLETEIEYSGSGDPSASLVLTHPHSGSLKRQKITITTIDDFAKEQGIKIDFIKMDIEGYEKEAMLGGKTTLSTHKPALSFSAYHKPNDKVELPQTLHSIRPDYSCRLLRRAEEVFCCD